MKKRISLYFLIISLVFSAVCIKENRVFALKERACIGEGCPQDIVSHWDYTDVYDLGVRYVVTPFHTFQLDYYISTYVYYSNGLLTSVGAPIFDAGDIFWSQVVDYTVSIGSSYSYKINSAKTSAEVTLSLNFRFLTDNNMTVASVPLEIVYTVS